MEGIADPVVEAAVEQLLGAILQARDGAFKFDAILTQLQTTLQFIAPKINRIYQLKDSNDFPTDDIQRLRQLLSKAEKFVNKSAEIAWWNYCQKYRYSKNLLEVDADLRRILGEVTVAVWEDTTCIMFQSKELIRNLNPLFLYERNPDGTSVSNGTGNALQVPHVVFGQMKVFRAVPKWIFLYLRSLTIRIRWCRAKRITRSFCQTSL